jgi:glycosyltransferase involved in cell wall biosynthesis
MADYLPQAIASVYAQDYPHIEYIVMDGGSTDGTLDILAKHEPPLAYISSPDGGTADAINRGLRRARGSIFAWLNADDTYLPGAVSAAVERLLAEPDAAAVYGNGYWVDKQGATLKPYPTRPYEEAALGEECFICQPTCFFRKSAYTAVGGLDASLHYAFDYDFWIRLARSHTFRFLPAYLATSRMHSSNKTLADRNPLYAENFRVLKRHFGYIPFPWIYGRVCYWLDRRDQFYNPLQPSIPAYCLSLLLGAYHNRRHPGRYLKEWFQIMSFAGLLRMWRRSVRGSHRPLG